MRPPLPWRGAWLLLLCLGCAPDYQPLLDRSCQGHQDCASGQCLEGYCVLADSLDASLDLPDPDKNNLPGKDPSADSGLDMPTDLREDTAPGPDQPAPPQGDCRAPGQACDPAAAQPTGYLCLALDKVDPEGGTCHKLCDFNTWAEGCALGSFCYYLGADYGACIQSDCQDPARSQAQCAHLEPYGGTCLPQGNGAFSCWAAGPRQQDERCSEQRLETDCASGLLCIGGRCEPLCDPQSDDCLDRGRVCAALGNQEETGVCLESCLPNDDDTCQGDRTCVPLLSDVGYCRDRGEQGQDAPCVDEQDCDRGLWCHSPDAQQPGACRQFCARPGGLGDAFCPTAQICVPWFEAYGVCSPGCAPLSQDNGCQDPYAQTCWPVEREDRGLCLSSGSIPEGQPCDLSQGLVLGQCAPDLICLGEPGQPRGACHRLCLLDEPGCDGPQRCQDWLGDALLGVCAEPL